MRSKKENSKEEFAKNTQKVRKEIKHLQRINVLFQREVEKRISRTPSIKHKDILQKNERQHSDDLFKKTFDHAAIGIAHISLDGKWLRANRKFCDIAGWSRRELLKLSFLDITHPEDHEIDVQLIKQLMDGQFPSFTMEKRYVRKDGTIRWVRATASLIRNEVGKPKYGIGIIEDIHKEKLIQDALRLLAEAGRVLSGSLDYNETLGAVANLVVPQLADWCMVDLLQENAEYKRVIVAYANPEDKKYADEFYKHPPTRRSRTIVEVGLASAKPMLFHELRKEKFPKYAHNAKHLQAILGVNVKSAMVIPLSARGKIFGAISFFSTRKFRRYSVVDLALAEQLASRAALAIDNARLYRKSQEAILLRDEFLSIASHEMKTPLTSIKGFTQIIEKRLASSLDDASRELLSKIDQQIDRITKLTAELLDVSQITAEKIILKKQSSDLNVVVADTVNICQQLAPTQEIVIKGKVSKKLFVDSHRIMQVISNLLINAIKYSPGAEKIIVTLSQDEKEVLITVRDFGIGIAEDKVEYIFDRFFRSDGMRKKGISGLGLGLYISNEIIKRHGGKIWVKSKLNKGTAMSVSLPVTMRLKKQAL